MDRTSSTCWFLTPPVPAVHILLGRHGDLIQMLPAWHELHRSSGLKPQIVVSQEYLHTLDGTSYIDPHPLPVHWWQGMPKARAYAEARWGGCTALAWWNEANPPPPEFRGPVVLNCHGHNWGVDVNRWQSYGHSMMERAGFPDECVWRNLPLVFDRRNRDRESELVARLYPPALRKKPLLLYNFTGISSPFGFLPELWPTIHRFAKDFHLVDLGNVRAHRIYDLLGLYDIAAGLLTCDTATLHLAPAATLPYIAWCVDGWSGSVPRGNCVLNIPYNETPRRLQEVAYMLKGWSCGHYSPDFQIQPA